MTFLTRKYLSRRTVLRGAGDRPRAAVPGCDGAGRYGTGEHGRGAEAATRVLLLSARRGHGAVDSDRRRADFTPGSDPRSAHAAIATSLRS